MTTKEVSPQPAPRPRVEALMERDLKNYCASGVIDYLRLKPVAIEDGSIEFEVWVKARFSQDELPLVTHRNKTPRSWANLHRAYEHIVAEYQFRGEIKIRTNL